MTFDFGAFVEFVDITVQYSNAVLVAVLPYVADYSDKLALHPALEFTSNAVSRNGDKPQES